MRKKNESAARESRLANGWTVEGAPNAAEADVAAGAAAAGDASIAESAAALNAPVASENDHDDAELGTDQGPAQMSNAMLVILGVFGGIYLMYTWVWFSWAEYYASANNLVAASSGSLGGVLQQIVLWVAPLAPIGWFLSVLLLNRGASTARIALWIVIGAVVLAPLPMFVWGA
ncbi:hypothetical protein JOF28_002760 [Leucobacter exalbidus]|uniref:DNA polymerase III subunit gamma/tau n=1 Tax=Leucobacter exalbidus TaxID=662960 RepID=A0A940T509_9MICO|nr:hypothetical protein [Leucobacter exalbidus]MBP1327528.1 hypothetical protein [Leucobacter exalbidus]